MPEHGNQGVHAEPLNLAADEIADPRLTDPKELRRAGLSQGPVVNHATQLHHEFRPETEILCLLGRKAEVAKHANAREFDRRVAPALALCVGGMVSLGVAGLWVAYRLGVLA